MELRVGSLFSGIGGLDEGVLDALYDSGIEARLVWQVETDWMRRFLLAARFPSVNRSVTDVRQAYGALAEVRTGGGLLAPVDLVVGGLGGQELEGAEATDRHWSEFSGLWCEFRRLVGELRPRAVIVENSAEHRERWVGSTCRDLNALCYRTRVAEISVADTMEFHLPERVFVLAVESPGGGVTEEPDEVDELDGLSDSPGSLPSFREWLFEREVADASGDLDDAAWGGRLAYVEAAAQAVPQLQAHKAAVILVSWMRERGLLSLPSRKAYKRRTRR